MIRSMHHSRPVLGRRGATLVEVLMSLMIIGLGLTSVFTLFPMSIIRSIKGTNLTNATLLAHNARDFYIAERTRIDIPPNRQNPDPLLTATPSVNTNLVPVDAADFVGTYVFDPFGGVNATAFAQTPGLFGFPASGSYGRNNSLEGSEVLRVANGLTLDNVSSWDSWITDFEGFITSINATQIQLDPAEDVSGMVGLNARVQLLSRDGRRSVIRPINPGSTGGAIIGLASPLPSDLDQLAEVSLVRVQNYERRYTWLLTVHINESGLRTAQIAVFFRRQLGEPEEMYNVLAADNSKRQIALTTPAAASPKAGDYIFGTWREVHPRIDSMWTRHGRWYRITAVAQVNDRTILTLDRSWVGGQAAGNHPKVMFPREIIGVYDIQ